MQTMNMDIVSVWNRVNRFIREMQDSASANVSLNIEWDVERLKTYSSALRYLVGHIDKQKGLDLPETNPVTYPLRPAPVLKDIENEFMSDCCRFLSTARDELINSQSSRLSTGLIHFDRDRFIAVIDRLEAYVVDYMEKATPLDLPESSPRAAVQGPGRVGLGNA
jgi:hypothetical protein